MTDMIEHHTHYKEIHGYDQTIWMTRSEHRLLHNQLRREGKCNIPPEELARISQRANRRTKKAQTRKKEWNKNNPEKVRGYRKGRNKGSRRREYLRIRRNKPEYKEYMKNYQSEYRAKNKDKRKEYKKEYYQDNKDKEGEREKRRLYMIEYRARKKEERKE